MDREHVKEEEREETLGKIIKEIGSSYYGKAFDECLRAPVGQRTEVYQAAWRRINQEEVLPNQEEWKEDLTIILGNFEALNESIAKGADLEHFTEFITTLEEYPYISQSKTLRKLYKEYKQKFEDYINSNKKIKKKKVKRKQTDSSEE